MAMCHAHNGSGFEYGSRTPTVLTDFVRFFLLQKTADVQLPSLHTVHSLLRSVGFQSLYIQRIVRHFILSAGHDVAFSN
jgi:hypothetical protein